MLGDPPYVSLRTFRRSGVGVDTPVWCAELEGDLVVFSAGEAGKVKRLRTDARAQVAPCDVRGKLQGDWVDAEAHILSGADEVARALAALRRKYGWQMALADLGSKLTGRFEERAYLRISPRSAA